MADQWDALKSELLTDPLGRGYAARTDQAVADSLNAIDRTLPRTSITTVDLYEAIVQAELEATLPMQQARVDRILGLGGDIDVRAGTQARTVLASVFGAATTTRANLVAKATTAVSRAAEVGFAEVVLAANVHAIRVKAGLI